MQLGFWNRLAVVGTVLALLITPLAIMVDTNAEVNDIREIGYDSCMKLASDTFATQAITMPELLQSQKKCWDFRFPDPDPAHQGWDEWREYAVGTAQFCAIVYALIWSIVATVKWVLRGRELSK